MPKQRLSPVSAGRGKRICLSPVQADPAEWLRSQFDWDENVAVVDMFSGVGGLSYGLDSAPGLGVVAAFEEDPIACETHRANMPATVFEGDVAQIEDFASLLREAGVRRVDVLAGGPPCQGFSRLGKGALRKIALENGDSVGDDRVNPKGQDKRNWMFRHFVRAVRQLEPKVVLIENVPEMLGHEPVIEELSDVLEELGYLPNLKELRADRHGVPQRRRRLFVIGTRTGHEPDWPRRSRVRRTVRDAIGDLPAIAAGHIKETIPWKAPEKLGPYLKLMRRGLPRVDAELVRDHVARFHRADDIRAFEYMREGDKYSAVPEKLRRYRDDIFTDKYHRMIWDEPAWTVTAHLAKDGYKYIHPEQQRTISVREAARLQSFPDSFRFAGPRTARYRHIGNAVPPQLAHALGQTLKDLVD